MLDPRYRYYLVMGDDQIITSMGRVTKEQIQELARIHNSRRFILTKFKSTNVIDIEERYVLWGYDWIPANEKWEPACSLVKS